MKHHFFQYLSLFFILVLLGACARPEERTRTQLFLKYQKNIADDVLNKSDYIFLDELSATYFATADMQTAHWSDFNQWYADKLIEMKIENPGALLSALPRSDEEFQAYASQFFASPEDPELSIWEAVYRGNVMNALIVDGMSAEGLDSLFFYVIHKDKLEEFGGLSKPVTKVSAELLDFYKERMSEADLTVLEGAFQPFVDEFLVEQEQKEAAFKAALLCYEEVITIHGKKHYKALQEVKNAFKEAMEQRETAYNVLTRKEYDKGMNKLTMPLIELSRNYNEDTAPSAEAYIEKGIYLMRLFPSTYYTDIEAKRVDPYLTLLKSKLMPAYRKYKPIEADLVKMLNEKGCIVEYNRDLPKYHEQAAGFDELTFKNMLMYCAK